jgi:hypothetical protein
VNDHHDDEVEARLRRTFAARGEDMAAADGAGWDPDASAGLLLSLPTSDRTGGPGRAGAARWRRRPALVAAASVLVAGIGAVGYGVAAAGGNDPAPVAATIDCQPVDDEGGSAEGSPEEDAVREAEARLLQVQAALDAEVQARADAVREAEAALAEAQAALQAEVQARLDAGAGADEPAADPCSTPPPPTTEVPPATTEPTPPTTEVPPATTQPPGPGGTVPPTTVPVPPATTVPPTTVPPPATTRP